MNHPILITPVGTIQFPCWLLGKATRCWSYYYGSNWSEAAASFSHHLHAPADADPATFPKPGEPCGYCGDTTHANGNCVHPTALPSPASAPADWPNTNGRVVDAAGNAIDEAASAEVGDWAANPVLISALAQFFQTWHYGPGKDIHGSLGENVTRILRKHAPQSQSKAEAEWFYPATEAEMTFPCFVWFEAHLNCEAAWSLQRNRGEYECHTSGGFRATRFACVRPATLNPPENAKGEGK